MQNAMHIAIKKFNLALSIALEKKLNKLSLNPSVCEQQPFTTALMTLLSSTRLMDLEEELNKPQYNSKRPLDLKKKKEKRKTQDDMKKT